MSDFKNLKVWKGSHELAITVVKTATRMRGTTAGIIRGQWVRAAISVPTNIAEGSGKQSDRDFIRFLRIARGSATETEYHSILARDLGLISEVDFQMINLRTAAVGKMLSGLIKALEARSPQSLASSV